MTTDTPTIGLLAAGTIRELQEQCLGLTEDAGQFQGSCETWIEACKEKDAMIAKLDAEIERGNRLLVMGGHEMQEASIELGKRDAEIERLRERLEASRSSERKASADSELIVQLRYDWGKTKAELAALRAQQPPVAATDEEAIMICVSDVSLYAERCNFSGTKIDRDIIDGIVRRGWPHPAVSPVDTRERTFGEETPQGGQIIAWRYPGLKIWYLMRWTLGKSQGHPLNSWRPCTLPPAAPAPCDKCAELEKATHAMLAAQVEARDATGKCAELQTTIRNLQGNCAAAITRADGLATKCGELQGEVERLKDWKKNTLNAIKQIPEFTGGDWGSGDKEGWGFCFELIRWLQRHRDSLEEAIRTHRSRKADDRCIEDDDQLYEALGDGVKCDRRVGDQCAMLENCKRFIENRTEGGGWKSYAELESEIRRLKTDVAVRNDHIERQVQIVREREKELARLRSQPVQMIDVSAIDKQIKYHRDSGQGAIESGRHSVAQQQSDIVWGLESAKRLAKLVPAMPTPSESAAVALLRHIIAIDASHGRAPGANVGSWVIDGIKAFLSAQPEPEPAGKRFEGFIDLDEEHEGTFTPMRVTGGDRPCTVIIHDAPQEAATEPGLLESPKPLTMDEEADLLEHIAPEPVREVWLPEPAIDSTGCHAWSYPDGSGIYEQWKKTGEPTVYCAKIRELEWIQNKEGRMMSERFNAAHAAAHALFDLGVGPAACPRPTAVEQPTEDPETQTKIVPQYRVRTWDHELEEFTPQEGMPEIVAGPGQLRDVLRTLRECGYSADRNDPSILVECVEPEATKPVHDILGSTIDENPASVGDATEQFARRHEPQPQKCSICGNETDGTIHFCSGEAVNPAEQPPAATPADPLCAWCGKHKETHSETPQGLLCQGKTSQYWTVQTKPPATPADPDVPRCDLDGLRAVGHWISGIRKYTVQNAIRELEAHRARETALAGMPQAGEWREAWVNIERGIDNTSPINRYLHETAAVANLHSGIHHKQCRVLVAFAKDGEGGAT